MSYFLPKGKAFLVSKLETLSIKEVLTWALISAGVRSPFSSRIAHAPVPLSFSQSAILWQASGRSCLGLSSQAVVQGRRKDLWFPTRIISFSNVKVPQMPAASWLQKTFLCSLRSLRTLCPAWTPTCCATVRELSLRRGQSNMGLALWLSLLLVSST